jgi:hypothetical protein
LGVLRPLLPDFQEEVEVHLLNSHHRGVVVIHLVTLIQIMVVIDRLELTIHLLKLVVAGHLDWEAVILPKLEVVVHQMRVVGVRPMREAAVHPLLEAVNRLVRVVEALLGLEVVILRKKEVGALPS